MACPKNFINATDYFQDAIRFLVEYKWVFQHANVAVLADNVLESFPKSFTNYFLSVDNDEFNRFPFVASEHITLECPELTKFREEIQRLLPEICHQSYPTKEELLTFGQHKTSDKKFHEITQLSQRIDQLCPHTDVLVDCGCGVGHLSEALHRKNQHQLIVGLECEKARVVKARQRHTELCKENRDSIVFQQHFITLDSAQYIEQQVREITVNNLTVPPSIEATKAAIIGLHTCADLSITCIKLFFNMPLIRHLIALPCCYHKMQVVEEEKKVLNFPLSEALRNVASRHEDFTSIFNRPFLRLACQQTAARWANTSTEEHAYHGEQMYYRALAEAIIDRETEKVVKRPKLSNSKDSLRTLPEDFLTFCQYYEVRTKDGIVLDWTHEHQSRFNKLNNKYDTIKGPRLMEGLICLQTTIQRLCENILLYDRLCYMQEYAEKNQILLKASYEKIFNEKLSPRCFVLIAEKINIPS